MSNIHIIGIGGAGMNAIAEVLHGQGHQVSGSDLADSEVVARLKQRGMAISIGHDEANVGDVDIVCHSTAIPKTNPEMVAAMQAGISVVNRAKMLSEITKHFKAVSVAGTHGKTTTSAMLTVALHGAGLEPSYIVGGDIKSLGKGAAVGSGDILVVEADESDGTFIELHSDSVIVTNIEPDHLEHYGSFENLEAAFVKFVSGAVSAKVVCLDDPGVQKLIESNPNLAAVTTYGTAQPGVATKPDWEIGQLTSTSAGVEFSVTNLESTYKISLPQPGKHNALNATAALAMAAALGADPLLAANALCEFAGVGRRFEQRGVAGDIRFVDDYAHLPTEVEAALQAGRSTLSSTGTENRLVAVFQPHRYSRTEQLWRSFANSFNEADILFVSGIYSSGEPKRPGISGELVANVVSESNPGMDVRFVESLSDLAEALVKELRAGDLCMTLGAGDLTNLPDRLISAINETQI